MTPVRLEPAAPRSRVKHSTTEPLRSRKIKGSTSFSSTCKLNMIFLLSPLLLLIDIFQLPRTLGAHLRLTLFKRGYLSSVIQKRLTTSLVVTCDTVSFFLGNHMMCFNKVIFSKIIFSFKVLMYYSRENVACFLCLLIILKCTLDKFYDGSKHNESRTDCNSCNSLIL